MIAVIETVRARAQWNERTNLPAGTGLGFACYWSHFGYVAQIHRVRVGGDGSIFPEKVWVVVDIGRHVVNPLNAEHQVTGSIIDALSAANGQRITFDRGRVIESNFDQYPLLRNAQLPDIDVHFHKTDHDPTGLGEPAHPSAIPAYCNAIFAATGRRIRSLPIDLRPAAETTTRE
jgi:isoquinoline 1-oxidoreductase beta subunit